MTAVRRLCRLTWRATQLSAIPPVAFGTLFARASIPSGGE